MNHGDLLLCRYLRGREVQRELPSTITYSQKFRGSAQRKSAQSFCRILCFFRLQVPMNHGDLLVFRCALYGRGVQRQLPSTITNGRNLVLMSQKKCPVFRKFFFFVNFGQKRLAKENRNGGGDPQVAPEKGLDPKLPRGSCRSASTLLRPIAGGRIANVVSKFRSGPELLPFSVTARRRGIQRESPSNLTNGQEAGKTFQRKMFHVPTVLFRLVRRFLLDAVIRAIGFSTSATF